MKSWQRRLNRNGFRKLEVGIHSNCYKLWLNWDPKLFSIIDNFLYHIQNVKFKRLFHSKYWYRHKFRPLFSKNFISTYGVGTTILLKFYPFSVKFWFGKEAISMLIFLFYMSASASEWNRIFYDYGLQAKCFLDRFLFLSEVPPSSVQWLELIRKIKGKTTVTWSSKDLRGVTVLITIALPFYLES